MEILREGVVGSDVSSLQNRLQMRGFRQEQSMGLSVRELRRLSSLFRRAKGLAPDGCRRCTHGSGARLCGRGSAAAAGYAQRHGYHCVEDVSGDSARPESTPICLMFLPRWSAAGLTTVPIVLAALATIRAETEGFVPISEYLSRYNTSPGGQPFKSL